MNGETFPFSTAVHVLVMAGELLAVMRTAEGMAFGNSPFKKSEIPSYQGDMGGDTERMANSHASSAVAARAF